MAESLGKNSNRALSYRYRRTINLFSSLFSWLVGLFRLPGRIEKLCTEFEKINKESKLVVPAGGGVLFTRFEDFIVGLPCEDSGMVASYTFLENIELGLKNLFKQTDKEGMVVADVGAHIGTYTLIASKLVGDKGKVFGIEPTPGIYGILNNNVQMTAFRDRVILFQKAVAERTGDIVDFHISARTSRNNSLLFSEEEVNPGQVIKVKTVSLDDILGQEEHVDVVKIDAEGSEPAILRGMSNLVEGNPHMAIFMEFAPEHIERSGISLSDFVEELLEHYGFVANQIHDFTGALSPLSKRYLMEGFSGNIFLRSGEDFCR